MENVVPQHPRASVQELLNWGEEIECAQITNEGDFVDRIVHGDDHYEENDQGQDEIGELVPSAVQIGTLK